MLFALQKLVPEQIPFPPALLAHVTPVILWPDPGRAVPAKTGNTELGIDQTTALEGFVMVTTGHGLDVTVSVDVPELFKLSMAVTVITFTPGFRAMPLADHEVVPTHVPLPPALFVQLTQTMLTDASQQAVPVSDTVELVVAHVPPEVGVVMPTRVA